MSNRLHPNDDKQAREVVSLSLATYNVHQWVGSDGRTDRSRIFRVLREMKAQILCLQEVTFSKGDHTASTLEIEADALAGETGMNVIHGPTFLKKNGYFGNVLLTSYPCLNTRRIDLSVTHREPRGAIDVEMDIEGVPVRVLSTHLGLRAFERRLQLRKLFRNLCPNDSKTTILAGDFNEWFHASMVLRELRSRFGPSPALRTFPSRFPIFALDRIWVRPTGVLEEIQVHNTPLARFASDHLPVKARLLLSRSQPGQPRASQS